MLGRFVIKNMYVIGQVFCHRVVYVFNALEILCHMHRSTIFYKQNLPNLIEKLRVKRFPVYMYMHM